MQTHSLSLNSAHMYTHKHTFKVSRRFHPCVSDNYNQLKKINKNLGKKLTKNMFEPYLNGSGFWMDMYKIVNKIYNMHNMPPHYIPKQA